MKLQEKFGIYGIDDERTRRVLYPNRVVLTRGNVTGAENLKKFRPAQVAIYSYADACVLDNRDAAENAAVLVDFGREIHGTVTVSIWTVSTQHADFRIRFGESVSEAITPIGEKGSTNDHAERDMTFGAASWSSNETNESGFRFVYLELLTPNCKVDLRCIEGTLIFRDIEYKGSFQCSDPLVNQIYDTAAYTVHLNMQRYLWDGIKRDRLVWAGDMNTELATIFSVFGPNPVVTKSLDLVREITPVEDNMNGLSSYNLWWMLCHYEWYMHTGDYEYLREQKDYIAAMMRRYVTYVDENGSENLPEGRFFDWPTAGYPDQKHAGLQGLTALALRRGGELLQILGESALADECLRTAERMKKHVPETAGGSKQSAALLAIGGICKPEDMYENVISKDGAAGFSTFLGYYTLSAVAEAGQYEAGLAMMKEYWGGMLTFGATTFWEDFDIRWMENAAPITDVVPEGKKGIHADYGAYCYTNLRHSLCHGWASGPAPWLAKYILGIEVLEPGCKKIRFNPHLAGLEWVKGTYPTPYGLIEVEVTPENAICRAPEEITVVRG